jgi:hypothetical protein
MHICELVVKVLKGRCFGGGGVQSVFFSLRRILLLGISEVHICILMGAFNQVGLKNFVLKTVSCTLGTALRLFFRFELIHF